MRFGSRADGTRCLQRSDGRASIHGFDSTELEAYPLGMTLAAALLAMTLAQVTPPTVSTVPCKTVDDCWLDQSAQPVKRPKGKRPPKPSCSGKGLVWLRTKLSCEHNVCVAVHIGDKC